MGAVFPRVHATGAVAPFAVVAVVAFPEAGGGVGVAEVAEGARLESAGGVLAGLDLFGGGSGGRRRGGLGDGLGPWAAVFVSYEAVRVLLVGRGCLLEFSPGGVSEAVPLEASFTFAVAAMADVVVSIVAD
jgi:hypothetical protein